MLCMEGSKSFALINHQIYCDLFSTDLNDSKISNSHHIFDSLEEDNWNLPNYYCYTCLQVGIKNRMVSNFFIPQKFCNSIWQPPKQA